MFAASFLSILATAAVVVAVIGATADDRSWTGEMKRGERFVSSRLVAVWEQPDERDQLIAAAARDLEVQITLRDARGKVLVSAGPAGDCLMGNFAFAIEKDGVKIGDVVSCRPGERSPPWRGFLAVASALLVLWTIAGLASRRASRPMQQLVDVARRIGEGDLTARPHARHSVVEIALLAEAIGEMAERIEQQMKDQRALLAGASHELRTPLGHLRILVELLRTPAADGTTSAKVIDDVEREVVEMDALVGKLLASARLDFSMADKREIDAADLARRALERIGEPVAKLVIAGVRTSLTGDPTLLLGALTNLLENARSHGTGVETLTVEARDDDVRFVVDDAGPGIPAADEERVFEPFFHKAAADHPGGSLGLGLALVRRIAEAHGGSAFATTRPEGGGRVGFTVARARA